MERGVCTFQPKIKFFPSSRHRQEGVSIHDNLFEDSKTKGEKVRKEVESGNLVSTSSRSFKSVHLIPPSDPLSLLNPTPLLSPLLFTNFGFFFFFQIDFCLLSGFRNTSLEWNWLKGRERRRQGGILLGMEGGIRGRRGGRGV